MFEMRTGCDERATFSARTIDMDDQNVTPRRSLVLIEQRDGAQDATGPPRQNRIHNPVGRLWVSRESGEFCSCDCVEIEMVGEYMGLRRPIGLDPRLLQHHHIGLGIGKN
jgi:hypothetical protein